MKTKILVFSILFLLCLTSYSEIFPGISGEALLDSIVKYYKSTTNLGYDNGRDTLYGKIDNIGGYLTCVYSGYSIYMQPGQDPSTWAYTYDINCEHTWPQSLGAEGIAKGDLHHLYATEVDVNGARGNLPFGDINDSSTNRWYRNNAYITSIPTSLINEYSELLTSIKFEPREDHKGNAARSMFYFYTMYRAEYLAIDSDTSFFKDQMDELFAWHYTDAVDSRELTRTWQIAVYQQNKPNPYIIDTTLIRRAFYPLMHTDDETALNFQPVVNENMDIYIDKSVNVLHIASAGVVNVRFMLYDITGRVQITEQVYASEISLNNYLSKNGIYFVAVEIPGKTAFKEKIVFCK